MEWDWEKSTISTPPIRTYICIDRNVAISVVVSMFARELFLDFVGVSCLPVCLPACLPAVVVPRGSAPLTPKRAARDTFGYIYQTRNGRVRWMRVTNELFLEQKKRRERVVKDNERTRRARDRDPGNVPGDTGAASHAYAGAKRRNPFGKRYRK